ncbi:transcription termination factor NusA [Bacteroidales bacterium OttesenSCG-928-C03]|nr:transcription termination factor NusA [Bacteroidales bacterium OttesenSCG-928-E04]MDL2308131.1 transcription termination factor NusA [Bacteroidales bacterium OttesenSCG-928-C03]MDL2325557.1 transcription termination factor NusA [Bacteroidales bacterium OttesenSCG-928-A14]
MDKMEDNLNLIETFAEFKEFKNIERETLMRILEDVFRSTLTKKYGPDANFEVIVNVDRGDLEIQRYREIVEDEEVENEFTQIALSEAIKIEPDFEVGEEVMENIRLSDFARREILSLRQNLISKIMEYEKNMIYSKYENRIGELITGEVSQVWRKEILVLDEDGVELVLPKTEQIPGDKYKKGDSLSAVVSRVEIKGATPVIIISRTAPTFLERLMEMEIPEVYDGLITIKNVVRSPGERAKVLVESFDDRIDPVGACVGMKGSRIHSIVRELRNENIDVINYTSNINLLISRALSPAKITSIEIDEENKTANVYMKPDQVSLAIGKGGYNIKLASKLAGYEIDVFRDDIIEEEDVDLDEFIDEFDQWVIDAFKNIGCDTAKSVLNLKREELIQRTDLEEETVDAMLTSIRNELDID